MVISNENRKKVNYAKINQGWFRARHVERQQQQQQQPCKLHLFLHPIQIPIHLQIETIVILYAYLWDKRGFGLDYPHGSFDLDQQVKGFGGQDVL